MEYFVEKNCGQAEITSNTAVSLTSANETYFTIKHLSEFSGIKPHTIRIWEQRFSFFNPQRTETSRRYYTAEQVALFLEICLLKQNGYRMNQIARMNGTQKEAIVSGIKGPQKYIKIVHELIGSMAAMDVIHFNNILDKCVYQWGIHETIKFVVIPFSERTGLFDSPEIKSYRRNIFLVMECIKQKIYLAIESTQPVAVPGRPMTVLLFPSGSSTELPLLYLYYLIKKEGFTVIYVGKYFSFTELDVICNKKRPDYIVTHLPGSYHCTDLDRFIKCMPCYLPGGHFISAERSETFDKHFYYYRHADNFGPVPASLNGLPD
jgi:DNA-binding transcriptional MerR regulator